MSRYREYRSLQVHVITSWSLSPSNESAQQRIEEEHALQALGLRLHIWYDQEDKIINNTQVENAPTWFVLNNEARVLAHGWVDVSKVMKALFRSQ